MALLFLDSFDHYATADLAEKWTSASAVGFASVQIDATGGRRSGGSLRLQSDDTDDLVGTAKGLTASGSTVVVGVALKLSALPSSAPYLGVLQLLDGASAQVSVAVLSAGTLRVARGGPNGTVLGTTTATLAASTYAYLELQITVSPTVGTVELRKDGVSVLSLTTQNTSATGTTAWTSLVLGQRADLTYNGFSNIRTDYDDLYVLDGSGSAPLTTFLGDCRVDARYPTAEGASSAWTPLSGTDNALMVDETAPDDDTTYNSTATIGATDTHVVQDVAVAGGALYGVQLCLSVRKTDAGTCSVAPVVRHGSTDYPGTATNPGTSYAYHVTPYGLNPGTAAPWTEADVNAAQFGYTRTA